MAINSVVFAFGHRARSGKDTAANEIIKQRGLTTVDAVLDKTTERYDIRKYGFADALKIEVTNLARKAGGMEKLNLAVLERARSKVQIRVLLNIESMGHAITKINSRTASFLQQRGVIVKFGQVGVATHAKMVLIDDQCAITTESHLTSRPGLGH